MIPALYVWPPGLDFGTAYQGSLLEGSFQVFPAIQGQSCRVVSTLNDRPHQGAIELAGPFDTRRNALTWKVRVNTVKPGILVAGVNIDTDSGAACQWIRVELRPGPSPCKNVLFCDSPFGFLSNQGLQLPLKSLTRTLGIGLNTSDRLPDDLRQFEAIILHWGGLDHLLREERARFHDYLRLGKRLVVFADHFFEGSIMKANHLTEPYGILLKEHEYNEVICGPNDISLQTSAGAVESLYWSRPSPILVAAGAKLIVSHPTRREEGFVARGGPYDNLFVVGASLLDSLLCVGWPFDNGCLFASLVGGLLV